MTTLTDMCCDPMTDALRWNMVELVNGEFTLPRRSLLEVNAEATAGNVLTGESYDPADFSLTLAIVFCPWCGVKMEMDPALEDSYQRFLDHCAETGQCPQAGDGEHVWVPHSPPEWMADDEADEYDGGSYCASCGEEDR